MEREIISIDDELCNGCGDCIPGCPEGALQIIDGKARLVSDLMCDGLGACLGECPVGAITIEKREAEPYDEEKVMSNIIKHGEGTVIAHLSHLKEHNETEYLNTAINYMKKNGIAVPDEFGDTAKEAKHHAGHQGCPGSMAQEFKTDTGSAAGSADVEVSSQLSQWPIQLHLLNPNAPYFKNADLLVAADCIPFSYPNFHSRMLKGKKLIIFCPKLDSGLDTYIDKLSELINSQDLKSITLAHMEVPCCFGVDQIVKTAIKKANSNVPVEEITVSIKGEIKE